MIEVRHYSDPMASSIESRFDREEILVKTSARFSVIHPGFQPGVSCYAARVSHCNGAKLGFP